MIQNEKYNLSRMNKLSLLTVMALGAGLIVIHFFCMGCAVYEDILCFVRNVCYCDWHFDINMGKEIVIS